MSAAWRMRALCLAGRIILENGGETYRAEDTVVHMAQALGLKEVDVFGIPSGLFISYTDEDGERETSVCRVFLRGTHLSRVDAVNQLSRRLTAGTLAPGELLHELRRAARIGSDLPRWYGALTAFLTAAGFAVMFGGGLVDMLVGGVSAALCALTPLLLRDRDEGGMGSVLLGGLGCAFLPLVFHKLTGLGVTEAMIAGAIMPLVPGLSMTNAVQDILRGDMVSGVAHAARAVMVAALLAGGALIGTHMSAWVPPAGVITTQAALPYTWRAAAVLLPSTLLAGAGFGALLYAPRKAIFWGGLLGAAGYFAYWGLMAAGVAETVAMFFGALLASVGAQLAARKLKMIATVFVTIAILPLVPGVGLYRAMSAIATGDLAGGGGTAAHTMALILMIALGIGLGSAIAGTGRRLERGQGGMRDAD